MLTPRQELICAEMCSEVYKREEESEHFFIIRGGKYQVEFLAKAIDKTLYIAFQGSNGIWDWYKNIQAYKVDWPYGRYPHVASVHDGFKDMFTIARAHSNFSGLLEDKQYNKILFTGHSQGAAIATLVIDYLVAQNLNVGGVFFASPRIGNSYFRDGFNINLPNFVSYRFGNDLVTHVPSYWRGFRHVGKLKQLGKKRWCKSISDHSMDNYLKAIRERNLQDSSKPILF